MRKTHCTIGAPFSANAMYVPVGKGCLVKSRRYRVWLEKNIALIQQNMDPAEKFPVQIETIIIGGRDWNDTMDVDNSLKPTVDLLVKAGIIPDDNPKYVASCYPRYFPGGTKSPAVMKITYIEPESPLETFNQL